MYRLITILGGVLLAYVVVFAETPGQSAFDSTIDALRKKVAALEAKVEKCEMAGIRIRSAETTANWGTGWYFGPTFSSPMQGGLEAGYYFNGLFRQREKYVNNKCGYRLGLACELIGYEGEVPFYNNNIPSMSDGVFTSIKILGRTPILVNLISISGYVKPILILPADNGTDNSKTLHLAYGLGWDIDFWVKSNTCFYVGLKGEREFNSYTDTRECVYPASFRGNFGVKIFLKDIKPRKLL